MAIEIKEVKDKTTLKKFVKFNIQLYKDCPYHVPVLIEDEMMTLDKDKNPAFEFCESICFLAYKDDQIVGRIAGIINPRSNEAWNQKYARFSFVDFIDDEEVSKALFDAVEKWALNKGMNGLQGPLGFTDMDHEGLLVDGFDKLGTMATSYSYPYYPKHIENLGFIKDQDWNEFRIKIPQMAPEKIRRISEIIKQKTSLRIKKFKKTKEVWPYAYKIFKLWNDAYRPLYGYSELSDKQIEYYVKMYIPMLKLELISVAINEEDDSVVGIAIALPSLSKALRKAKGSFFPLGWIYLLNALYGKNDTVDLYIIGVASEYQNKGVNAMLFHDIITSCNKIGYKEAESNPELELNHKMQSQWKDFDVVKHKTRRAYLKHLK